MRSTLVALLILAVSPAVAQERLAATDINIRTFVTFKASDTAVQKLLPGGWTVHAPTSGPSKGYNLGSI